jgi:2-polyprenyl-3-methyl-5-hydroxy-6-metoxy-1,4-benzoquinol methylase
MIQSLPPKPATNAQSSQAGGAYNEYFKTRSPIGWSERLICGWHRRMFQHVASRIPCFLGLSVLEIGTGFGYFAQVCKHNGVAYTGIEMNEKQTEALCNAGYDVVTATIPPIPAGKPVQTGGLIPEAT